MKPSTDCEKIPLGHGRKRIRTTTSDESGFWAMTEVVMKLHERVISESNWSHTWAPGSGRAAVATALRRTDSTESKRIHDCATAAFFFRNKPLTVEISITYDVA